MRRLIGPIAAVVLLLGLALPVAAGNQNEKLTICHATSSENNPFVSIKVPPNSGFEPHLDDNANPLAGHEQDFLLENTDLEDCDDVADVEVTPLAPTVGAATCDVAGTLTLTAVEGVIYTVEPEYTAGASGDFTVTATADEDAGFVIAEGAQTTFEVTVAAKLNCVAAVAPSVSGATCAAPGALTLNAVTGVTYAVNPAYAAGASGSFTVTASASAGFTLTGPSVFAVNVPAKLVCSGTQGGNPTPAPVRTGTLANTAMEAPVSVQLPVALLALVAIASVAYLGHRNVMAIRGRR